MRIRKILDAHEKIFRVSALLFALCGVLAAVFWLMSEHRSSVYSGSVTIPVIDVDTGVAAVYTEYADDTRLTRNHISISLTNLSVDVIRWSGSDIKVEYISETPILIETDETHVTITQDERFSFSLFTRSYFSYGMRVYLPPNYYRELNIGTAGGNVTLSSVEAGSVGIHTRGGNITADNVAGTVVMQSVSGNITAALSGIANTADFVTDYGSVNIAVEDYLNAALDFVTKSGRLKTAESGAVSKGVTFPLGQPPYSKITIATVTGNATVTVI